MNRLSRALMELADALGSAEREEPRSGQSWFLPTSPALSQRGVQAASASVGAASTPIQSKQRAEKKFGKKGPTGSNVAYHGDHHCYVIMVHPRGLVGFGGPGASTWRRRGPSKPASRRQDFEEAATIWAKFH